MRSFEDAKKSLARVTFNEEQRNRAIELFNEAENFLQVLWNTASPCPELTLATRALEEAIMWHSKAIANESKDQQ